MCIKYFSGIQVHCVGCEVDKGHASVDYKNILYAMTEVGYMAENPQL